MDYVRVMRPCDTVEKRRLWGDLIAAFQYFKTVRKHEGSQLFTWVNSDRTRRNGFKLKEGRYRLDVGGDFFFTESDEVLAQAGQRSCAFLEVFKGWLEPWAM